MLDFNSRSALTDRINFLIDEAIDATVEESQRRGYLGASVVGHQCERHVQFHLLAAQGKVNRKTPSARIMRIFDRGNVYEEKARFWLKNSGFLFGIPPKGKDFSDFGGIFKGHVDGIITGWKRRGYDPPIELPALWENKCLSSKSWKKLEDDKLQKYSSTYYAQVQVYMLYTEMPRCLFTAVNADTMELYHEVVVFNAVDAQLYRSRAGAAITACSEGYYLNRLIDNPSFYVCKMCDFREACHA